MNTQNNVNYFGRRDNSLKQNQKPGGSFKQNANNYEARVLDLINENSEGEQKISNIESKKEMLSQSGKN